MEKHPDEKLEVYAVWFNMFFSDSRSGWPKGALTDARVRHFWDESKLVGQWYGENVTEMRKGHIEWDAYFLYGPDAEWDDKPKLVSWGRTIVSTRAELQRDLDQLFRK